MAVAQSHADQGPAREADMTTMVETVAQAIRDAFPHIMAGSRPKPAWDRLPESDRETWRKMARAAIDAQRVPTDGMIEAGHAPWAKFGKDAAVRPSEIADLWENMIDFALKENKS